MAKVKCAICGQTFDYEKVQGVKYGARRYAHLACYPDGELVPLKVKEGPPKRNQEREELLNYCKQLFKTERLSPKILSQIKRYVEEYQYSYSGILNTLKWWYEIKGNSLGEYGATLGIVPHVYDEAKEYFYAIYLAQKLNANAEMHETKREVSIDSPRVRNRIKLFNMEEGEEEK